MRCPKCDVEMERLVNIAGQATGETGLAYRIFDGARAEWVQKSQVQKNNDGTFTMPGSLAKEKGFI